MLGTSCFPGPLHADLCLFPGEVLEALVCTFCDIILSFLQYYFIMN